MGGKGSGRTGRTQMVCARLPLDRVAQLEAYMRAEGVDKTKAIDSLLEAGLAVKGLIAKRKKSKKDLQ